MTYMFAIGNHNPKGFESFSVMAAAALARVELDNLPRIEERGGFATRSCCRAVWVPEIRHLEVYEGCHSEKIRGWSASIQAVFHTETDTCIGWINFNREDTKKGM